jgi:hypothetical protein
MHWLNSRLKRTLPILIVSALSGPMLQGCANFGDKAGELKVKVTSECNKLRGHARLPAVSETSDYADLAADAGVAANDSDRKNDRYATCVDRVIDNFAKGGVQ